MALMPTLLSLMQPTMTFRPSWRCGGNHSPRGSQAPGFRQFDIDAVEKSGATRHVFLDEATFVGDDRQRALSIDALHAFPIGGLQRLFNEFDAELFQLGREGNGLVRRPRGIGVNTKDGLRAL